MTNPSVQRRAGPFTGTGALVSYPFTFRVYTTSDVAVTFADDEGTEIEGVLDSTFLVTLNVDQEADPGGSVQYAVGGVATALPLDYTLAIDGATPYSQDTSLPQGGSFNAKAVERALDRLSMQIQQVRDAVERAVQVTVLSPAGTDVVLPVPSASAVIGWNADGTGLRNYEPDTSVSTDLLEARLNGIVSALDGAGISGWSPDPAYAANTVGKKLKQIIHVEDDGAVGDGVTDDYTAITDAIARGVAAGRPVVFDGTKTYYIGIASWSIPAGAKLQTNGATFVCPSTTTGNTVWLTCSSCTIDELNISVPTGIRRDRVVLVDGTSPRVGKIKVHSVDQQANTEAADGAVQITGTSPFIGLVDVKNYDRALIGYSSSLGTIFHVLIESYVRGMYLYDNAGLKVYGGRIHTASVNASGTAGHNGVLMGCNSTDAQRNVVIENLAVEDSGEHAWRIGGPEQQSNLRFSNCSAHNCGGSGFKVLGTDSGTPTARNKSITLDNFIAEDVGEDSGLSATNRCGVYFAFCDDFQIGTPIVRPRNNANSAQYGIHIQACSDGVITSPILREAVFDGLLIYASNGNNTNIQVNGGEARGCDRHGVNILTDASMSTGRCVIDGFNSVANGDLGFNINNSGTMSENLFRIKTYANTNGMGACNNTPGTTLQISGTPGSTAISGISARNGSWIDDNTTLNIRKAGAWTAL